MKNRTKRLASVAATILAVASLVTFAPSAPIAAADDSETVYYIEGYNNDTHTVNERGAVIYDAKDSNGNAVGDWLYCSSYEKASPKTAGNYGTTFTRSKLSQSAEYTDEQKKMVLTLLLEPDAAYNKIDELAQNNEKIATLRDQVFNTKSGWQHVIWAIQMGQEYAGRADYDTGLRHVCNDKISDSNDPDSLWQQLFVPLFDFLNTESSKFSFNDYDAYIYKPKNDDVQYLIGSAFKLEASSISFTKSVLDKDGNPYVFNGEDDSQGFEITVNIKDMTAKRAWATENVEVISSDTTGSGSDTVKTDAQGNLTFRIDNGETITLSGFEHRNYQFNIVESSDNMGNDCVFKSLDGTVVVSSSLADLTSDPKGSVTIVNEYDYTAPTPTATPSPTAEPSPTVTPTPEATPASEPTATPVPTATPTAVPTATSVPTATPAPTVTATPVPTEATTPTSAPTATATATPATTINTQSENDTVTPTTVPPVSSEDKSDNDTAEAGPTPPVKASSAADDSAATPTPTPAPTATPTPTPTPVPNRSGTVRTGERLGMATVLATIVFAVGLSIMVFALVLRRKHRKH